MTLMIAGIIYGGYVQVLAWSIEALPDPAGGVEQFGYLSN
jgi:hypothetical protein